MTLSYIGWPAIFVVLALLGGAAILAMAVFIREPDFTPRKISLGQIGTGYASVLSNRRIMSALLTGAFAIGGLFAFVAGSPFVYIKYFGVAPEYYGFLMGLNAIAMILANVVNAELLGAQKSQSKALAGAVLLAASGLIACVVAVADGGLILLLCAIVIFAGALEFVATNAIVTAMTVMPSQNGTVSAISGAAGFALGGVSSAIVGYLPSVDALPMTAAMAACGVMAAVCAISLGRTEPRGPMPDAGRKRGAN